MIYEAKDMVIAAAWMSVFGLPAAFTALSGMSYRMGSDIKGAPKYWRTLILWAATIIMVPAYAYGAVRFGAREMIDAARSAITDPSFGTQPLYGALFFISVFVLVMATLLPVLWIRELKRELQIIRFLRANAAEHGTSARRLARSQHINIGLQVAYLKSRQ